MKFSKKLQKEIDRFYLSVKAYIILEYRTVYNEIYTDPKISKEVKKLSIDYYFGGNTVPFTAGQVVDYVKSKYMK